MKKISFQKTNLILKTVTLPLLVVLVNLLIILFPKESMFAAKDGLNLWFKNVLPSLLPFLIGTNLLMSLGFVNFLGTLLEPIMSPLFGVPGKGGFALAVGLLSGYPMGAKVTASLSEKNELTKEESERLIRFVNNSGPLFIIGAIGSGMLNNTYAGYFIITVHYISALFSGIMFNLLKKKSYKPALLEKHILRRAYRGLRDVKYKDRRSFGAKLGDSVSKSMETILQIGGFIILFSVIAQILDVTNAFYVLESIFNPVFNFLGLSPKMGRGVLTGAIEITNGVKLIAEEGLTKSTLIATVAIVSWGGFSIHAQSINFLSKSNISSLKYLFGKLIHAGLSILFGVLLFPLFENKILLSEAVEVSRFYDKGIVDSFIYSSIHFAVLVLIIFIIGLFSIFLKNVINKKKSRS